MPTPLCPTLFPYTTLFRSQSVIPVQPLPGRQAAADEPALASRSDIKAALAWLEANLARSPSAPRSEEHTSELQSRENLVCRLLLEKKNKNTKKPNRTR